MLFSKMYTYNDYYGGVQFTLNVINSKWIYLEITNYINWFLILYQIQMNMRK